MYSANIVECNLFHREKSFDFFKRVPYYATIISSPLTTFIITPSIDAVVGLVGWTYSMRLLKIIFWPFCNYYSNVLFNVSSLYKHRPMYMVWYARPA